MTIPSQPIAVLGAGSWGTALALLLARNGNCVHLWSHDPEHVAQMHRDRVNDRYLPDFIFPDKLKVFSDLSEAVAQIQDILIVVPSNAFRSVLEQLKPHVRDDIRLAWGTKGIDPDTKQFLHEVTAELFSPAIPMAMLAGPSFALEVAQNKPTAVSLVADDKEFMHDLIERFHNDRFRVYENHDLVGVQLCGAVKNVLAVAVGIADGLELGANTRSALITRGLAEMTRLGIVLGGRAETFMGLAGVGDLVLTCTDNLSRNRRFGLAIGQGFDTETALQQIGQAVEGLHNTRQVYELATSHNVEMPITEQVNAVLFSGHKPIDVLGELLQRAPRSES